MIKILQPLGTLVLVKLGDAKKKTDSGLILPDSSVEPPQEGQVVRVGWQDRPTRALHDVKPGDTVMLPKFGGTELTFNDCEFRLVEEADLLGVVRWVDLEAPNTEELGGQAQTPDPRGQFHYAATQSIKQRSLRR